MENIESCYVITEDAVLCNRKYTISSETELNEVLCIAGIGKISCHAEGIFGGMHEHL